MTTKLTTPKAYWSANFQSQVCNPPYYRWAQFLKSTSCKIVHIRGNHWIIASTMMSEPNTVNVYDSTYNSIDVESLKIIQQLFRIAEVHMVPVQKQQGFSDCVDYLQLCMLCSWQRNANLKGLFHQPQMRSHLVNCLSQGKMSSFPCHHHKWSGELISEHQYSLIIHDHT